MDATGQDGPAHDAAQLLLPWYVTGELDAAERQAVEDHLIVCALCRADLAGERLIGKAVATMPVGVDLGWAAMRERIAADSARPRSSAQSWTRWIGANDNKRPIAWALLAAQLLLLVTAIAAFAPLVRPAPYRALGAAPVAAAANALVIFRPETRQGDVARLLGESEARIVDGPTVTGALLLHVAPDRRASTLARWQARSEVALAEPIDR